MNEFKTDSQQSVSMLANNLGYNIDDFSDEQLGTLSLLASMSFDPCNIPEVKPMLRWNGTEIITKNNVVVFTGKEGQGKSTAMSIVTAVLMGGKDFAGLQRMQSVNRVLWIDTEQATHNLAKRLNTLCSLAGFPIEKAQENGLYVLQMKKVPEIEGCDIEQARREYINMAIEWVKPELVVIDGIFDCATDEELTTPRELVHWLEDLTSRDITIFTSIHTNKADSNLPYQLGHELTKKCSDIFLCERGEEEPVVCVKHTRAKDTDRAVPIQFKFTDNGVQGVDQYHELREQVKTIFADTEQFEGWDSIKKALKAKCDLTPTTASKVINTAISRGYIKKDGLIFTKSHLLL